MSETESRQIPPKPHGQALAAAERRAEDLLSLLHRTRALDELSPAQRALEQRDIDRALAQLTKSNA